MPPGPSFGRTGRTKPLITGGDRGRGAQVNFADLLNPATWGSMLGSGWGDMGHAEFWVAVVKIIWINILLSGDNAVVIARACRPNSASGAWCSARRWRSACVSFLPAWSRR